LLDEPSRGLSEFDVKNLLDTLTHLTRVHNHTFVIVEHHPLFETYADHVIRMGEGAGPLGGKIVERYLLKEKE
jgi:excinuclease ABC subunit A